MLNLDLDLVTFFSASFMFYLSLSSLNILLIISKKSRTEDDKFAYAKYAAAQLLKDISGDEKAQALPLLLDIVKCIYIYIYFFF